MLLHVILGMVRTREVACKFLSDMSPLWQGNQSGLSVLT